MIECKNCLNKCGSDCNGFCDSECEKIHKEESIIEDLREGEPSAVCDECGIKGRHYGDYYLHGKILCPICRNGITLEDLREGEPDLVAQVEEEYEEDLLIKK